MVKKTPGVVASSKKADNSAVNNRTPKKPCAAKTVKPGSKSSNPASKPSSSDSSRSSSEEEQSKPAQKAASKVGVGKSVTASKQAAAESSSSSDSSSDEEPEEKGGAVKKKLKKSCSTSEKKKPKTSLNSTGKTAASKNVKGKAACAVESSSSDEGAENGGRWLVLGEALNMNYRPVQTVDHTGLHTYAPTPCPACQLIHHLLFMSTWNWWGAPCLMYSCSRHWSAEHCVKTAVGP